MSYLFNKRIVRAKKKTEQIPTENNSGFKPETISFKSSNQKKQATTQPFQGSKKLRRVQLRGWK
jgi:hypothetical protein